MSDYTFTTADADLQKRTIQLFEEYHNKHTPDLDTINRLVTEGIDVHAQNENGYKPLHWAAQHGQREICKLLIKCGSDVNVKTFESEAALQNTVFQEDIKTSAFLLENGAYVNVSGDCGWTLLHEIVVFHKPAVAKTLFSYGANVWAVDEDGNTALHKDKDRLLKPHQQQWQLMLADVLNKNCDVIKTTQDLYHLASVMKPENPQNVPEPKEFIRELFAKYLPHDEKFNKLYSTIFNKPRGPETLAETRDAARRERRGVL